MQKIRQFYLLSLAHDFYQSVSIQYNYNNIIILKQNQGISMNPNKYYHNDYKKMMGLDQTRTASEKILDRVIGKPIPKLQVKQQKMQKKVKEQNVNMSHRQVFDKLMKNMMNNVNALKMIKPLNILRKCLGDLSFVSNIEVNTIQNWQSIIFTLINVQEKLVGNVSQKNQIIQTIIQIFTVLSSIIRKLSKNSPETSLKQQHLQQIPLKQQQSNNIQSKPQNNNKQQQKILIQLLKINQIYLLYYKLYTDDSFIFNKLLTQFKHTFFMYYQLLSNGLFLYSQSFKGYLKKLLLQLFYLPHNKYEWLKQSLLQFYKEFNITYKHLLDQDSLNHYLKQYNLFINYKSNSKNYSENNSLSVQSKGGKIEVVEVISSDGFDKWNSKQ